MNSCKWVSTPEQVRHLVDRAVRIARNRRTVMCIIFPNDVEDLAAVETPSHEHGTVHSGIGYTGHHISRLCTWRRYCKCHYASHKDRRPTCKQPERCAGKFRKAPSRWRARRQPRVAFCHEAAAYIRKLIFKSVSKE